MQRRPASMILESPGPESGSVSAEFALALPAVVLMLGLLLGLGMHGAAQISLEEGARAAARELARGEAQDDAAQTASRVSGEDIDVAFGRDGGYARVTLSRPVRLMGLVELNAQQTAEAHARVEHVPSSEES